MVRRGRAPVGRALHLIVVLALVACTGAPSASPPATEAAPAATVRAPHPSGLDVVLLGTGTPVPDPARQGPAVGVVFEGQSALFDAGPGVVRQLAAAAGQHGQPALEPGKIRHVFLTHLHSDHTTGLPDVILGGWVLGRETPLRVYGPPGTKRMVDDILDGWSRDIAIRQGVEDLPERGVDVRVVEIPDDGGRLLDDRGLVITAFPVDHGTWEQAYGFRIEAGGRRVVLSGDTTKDARVAAACDGCDLLVHEVYSEAGFEATPVKSFQTYHGTFHTSGPDVGRIATEGRAGAVVLYHQLFFGYDEASLVDEVRSTYDGPVTSGHDLDRL